MSDRVDELLGASPAQPQTQPAQSSGPDRVDELLGPSVVKRGKYSDSVMSQKVVPLTDRKNTPEVAVSTIQEADVPGILAYSAARILKGDDDAALGNILAKHLPDAEVLYDTDPKTGQSVPYLSHKGKAYYLNKPGFSLADVENIGGQVAQYLPAGKIASAGKTLASQLRRAFLGAGATSVAGDVAVDAMGGGTGVDIPKAAVNAVVAPIAQGIGSKLYPLLKGNRFTGAFGQLTPEGADALRRAGVDPSLLNAQGIAQINETLARLGGKFGDDATAATQGNAAIGAQEGIRLTQGQASGDLRQIAREEAMRNYARGKGAGDTLKDFDTLQQSDIRNALMQQQAQLGVVTAPGVKLAPGFAPGSAPRFANEYEAGAGLTTGIRSREEAASNAIGAAYDEARRFDMRFGAESLPDLKARVRNSLGEAGVVRSEMLAPATMKAEELIKNVGRGTGLKFRDVSLQQLEKTRRELNFLWRSAKDEDRRGVRMVIKSLDDWIDNSVDAGLASGDPAAIEALKKARELRTRYGSMFEEGRGADSDAGKVLQKIINTDVTPNEAVNLIFGYGELGQAGVSVRVAKRLKTIVGADSPDWGQYREAAFMRLIGGPQGQGGPQVIVSRIDRALDGRGMSLTKEIFSEDEIKRLRALRHAINRTITPKGVANPSKTGYEVSRMLEDAFGKVSGIAGLLKGDAVGTAAALGVRTAKNAKDSKVAQAAVSGVPMPPGKGIPAATGAATYGAGEVRSRLWQWMTGAQSDATDAEPAQR